MYQEDELDLKRAYELLRYFPSIPYPEETHLSLLLRVSGRDAAVHALTHQAGGEGLAACKELGQETTSA